MQAGQTRVPVGALVSVAVATEGGRWVLGAAVTLEHAVWIATFSKFPR